MAIYEDLGFNQVIFEGNCKEVVIASTSKELIESKLYFVLFDVQAYLRNHPSWKIQFAYRDPNRVAHSFACLLNTLQGDST